MCVPEVSLGGGVALHGLVVSVQVRVIVDLKSPRIESGSDLIEGWTIAISGMAWEDSIGRAYLGPDDLFYRRAGTHAGDLATYG
jgi:hypothetical protein